MGFFNGKTKGRADLDIGHWQPEIIEQSEHFAFLRLPEGFVSTPANILKLFERLRVAGFDFIDIGRDDRIIVRKAASFQALERLARDLLDPEMYGFAVPPEVRDAARVALGLAQVESGKTPNA